MFGLQAPHFYFARSSAELHLEEGTGRGGKENHSRGSSLAWEVRTACSSEVMWHSLIGVWFFMDRYDLVILDEMGIILGVVSSTFKWGEKLESIWALYLAAC